MIGFSCCYNVPKCFDFIGSGNPLPIMMPRLLGTTLLETEKNDEICNPSKMNICKLSDGKRQEITANVTSLRMENMIGGHSQDFWTNALIAMKQLNHSQQRTTNR